MSRNSGLRGRSLEQAIDLRPQAGPFGFVRMMAALAGMMILAQVSGCSNFSFGPNIETRTIASQPIGTQQALPAAAGEPIGTGPVRVALLLPVTGDLANVGISMANGARLAMEFVQSSPSVGDNITLVLKDTRGDPAIAGRMASEAVSEGASLILGPLRAESVRAAGAVARSAGIPLIGFSNNTGAASAGVYLLNVLPEGEVRRSLAYAQAQGRRAFAAIVPNTDFGRIQDGAFRQAVADLGLNARAVHTFSNETEARSAVEQVIPLIQSGQVDALFIPDRATAPSFAVLLEAAGIDRTTLTIIGSADWDNDATIPQTNYLVGAIYPAIDDAGQLALRPEYQSRFGAIPHPFATIAYTATLLANSSALALGTPKYDTGQLTRTSGFNGRDGLFRFLPDGRSEYALTIKQVVIGGAQRVDGPKLP
jgi:ABC-type branched-subunit amino acid transport system substrate-binding protein